MKMIRFVVAIILLAVLIARADAYQADEIVLVVRDTELLMDGQVVEKAHAGMAVEIKVIDGTRLLVNATQDGWIDSQYVIPLDQGVSVFSAMILEAPDKASLYTGRAVAWNAQKDYGNAITDCDKAIQRDPMYLLAYHNRGIARQSQFDGSQKTEDLNGAIEDYSEVIRLDRKFVRAYLNRGIMWSRKNEHDKAIRDFNTVLSLEPQNITARLGRASALQGKGDCDKAITELNEARALDPKNPMIYVCLAVARAKKGDCQDGIADCNEAIRLNPASVEAYTVRGNLWDQLGDQVKAIADFDEVIRRDPKSFGYYLMRGDAWRRKGDIDSAIKDFTEAIRLNPEFALSFQARAFTLKSNSDYAAAIADFQQAIRLNPKLHASHNGLAWLYATCPDDNFRNADEALQHARKACEQSHWKNEQYLETLAAAYAEAGDWHSAIKRQEKAVELTKDEESKQQALKRLELYNAATAYRDESNPVN